MRLYKPKYKDKNGERKTLSKWWLELRDHKGKTRRFAGYSDKAATQSLGKQIERLIVVRSIGEQPGAELNNWLANCPEKRLQRFVKEGQSQQTRQNDRQQGTADRRGLSFSGMGRRFRQQG